jgi:hypothetical protein
MSPQRRMKAYAKAEAKGTGVVLILAFLFLAAGFIGLFG